MFDVYYLYGDQNGGTEHDRRDGKSGGQSVLSGINDAQGGNVPISVGESSGTLEGSDDDDSSDHHWGIGNASTADTLRQFIVEYSRTQFTKGMYT